MATKTPKVIAANSRVGKRLEWLSGKTVRLLCSANEYATVDPIVTEGTYLDAVQLGMNVFICISIGGKARLIKAGAVIEITEL